MTTPLFLGIDLGTGGVRCLLVDGGGDIVSQSRCDLAAQGTAADSRRGHSEQSPTDWNTALDLALQRLGSRGSIAALAVDSTSGTVLPVDGPSGEPLHNALLYNDHRAMTEAQACSQVLGESIGPTFGLPKILWMRKHLDLPGDARFVHAADYLNEQLAGCAVATDFTNAMKTAVDLETLRWPTAIETELGLPLALLPGIRKPGERLGAISPAVATQFGIPRSAALFAGATDSNAAFYASGASQAGEWCHTIGTTFALKGIASQKLHDPESRFYNHRHPDMHWLPGGASNCGGGILQHHFAGANLAALDEAAARRGTTSHLVYPLAGSGDRLPFSGQHIAGFVVGDRSDETGFYLGCLEGVAFVERLTIELLDQLGAPVGDTVFATGGGARSALWLQIRADITRRTMAIPACPESAFGAAILAAAGHLNQSVGETSRQMVRIDKRITPTQDPAITDYYETKFQRFKAECRNRSYGSR